MTVNPDNAILSKLVSDSEEVGINNPLPVAIISGGGGGGGGTAGTEYTEDAIAPANPAGGMVMAVRRDTLSVSEVSDDGDVVAAKATSKGEIYTKDTDVATAVTSTNTKLDTVIGHVDGLETLITSTNTKLDSLVTQTDSLESYTGALTETAPASDTASSGLNGRLQRVAQRITSLIALFPTSLGSKAAASSFAVTGSTEDVARLGSVTETAPASDTASSGLNGRLQRIAQRITSLIALVPAALGRTAAASSFAVVLSTEDKASLDAVKTATEASLVAGQLPAALGRAAASVSVAVALSTEDKTALDALVTASESTAAVNVVGDQAHDAALTENPVTAGGWAKSAQPTKVADGDKVYTRHDLSGRQVVAMHQARELRDSASVTLTSTTTATSLIAAQGSGIYTDILSITIVNTAATDTVVQLTKDDGTTVIWTGYAKAADMRGIVFTAPLKAPTANEAIKAKTLTSTNAVTITVQYSKET